MEQFKQEQQEGKYLTRIILENASNYNAWTAMKTVTCTNDAQITFVGDW